MRSCPARSPSMAERPPAPGQGDPASDQPGPTSPPGSGADSRPGADGPSPGTSGPPSGNTDPQAPRSQEADDAAFFDLVAHFDDEPDARHWPAAEEVGDTRRPTVIILRPPFDQSPSPVQDDQTDPGLDEARFVPGIGPHSFRRDDDSTDDVVVIDLGGAAETDGGGPRALDDPDDEHYIPPEPPPLPRIRPVTRWAIGSIALGMVFLVVPSLIGLNQSRSQDVTGVMLILGGVGTLVARLGERPPTDSDGPDDGAVI